MSMPLKAGREQANIEEALRNMAALVGDDRFDNPLFDSTDSEFSGILRTTWELLEQEKGWVDQLRNDEYRLTARGWIEALRATGALCNRKRLMNPSSQACRAGCILVS
jgi:hypothetical protein